MQLLVVDDGRGTSPEVRERALEPFYTTKPPGEGSGLGLAMVLGIVQEHEGAMEIESEEGKGTTVRCIFPTIGGEPGGRKGHASSLPRGEGVRLLYVDDEPALVAVGKRRLERLGYEVVASSRPEEALRVFKEDPARFDVVVTDLSMPHMDGLELAREIRKVAPDAAILLLSGFLSDPTLEEADAAGIRRVVQKPLTLPELAQAVASVTPEELAAGR